MQLMSMLLGSNKVLETSEPLKYVFGDFNGRMASSYLVNLNEINKREMSMCQDKFKALATDPKLMINEKFQKSYPIKSYHRFINCSNSDDPVPTKDGDRRNCIMKASDKKLGDQAYFDRLWAMLEDKNAMASIYDYLKKQVEDVPNGPFNRNDIPNTIHQSIIKQASRSYVDMWLEEFAYKYDGDGRTEWTPKELLNDYTEYIKYTKLHEETPTSLIGLGKKIGFLNNSYIKCKHTSKGNIWTINCEMIAKQYREHYPQVPSEKSPSNTD